MNNENQLFVRTLSLSSIPKVKGSFVSVFKITESFFRENFIKFQKQSKCFFNIHLYFN